jgi:hypothetical protein
MTDKLKDMGYLAHLVVKLLELGGPLTYEQMCRWLNPGVDGQLEATVDRLDRKGIIYKGGADLWFLTKGKKEKSSSSDERDDLARIIADVLTEQGYVRKPF